MKEIKKYNIFRDFFYRQTIQYCTHCQGLSLVTTCGLSSRAQLELQKS
jgi:hypothetical protein